MGSHAQSSHCQAFLSGVRSLGLAYKRSASDSCGWSRPGLIGVTRVVDKGIAGESLLLGLSAVGSLMGRGQRGAVHPLIGWFAIWRRAFPMWMNIATTPHTRYARDYPVLSQQLQQPAARTMTSGHTAHGRGTHVCVEGPAFSTRAVSGRCHRWQGDVVGMISLTEAKLAREAESPMPAWPW